MVGKEEGEMPVKEFVVKQESDLFEYLLSQGFKRARVKQLLKYKAVSVNSRPVERHDHQLHSGDRLLLSFEKKTAAEAVPKFGLKIVYEDAAVIVVDKPSGLLTIGTEKERTKTAYFQLNEFLRSRKPEKRERIFIVHRLDRETSGLIVFAKTETAKRLLQENWSGVEKLYLAVVEGVPREKKGTISGYLGETSTLRVYEARGPEKASYSVTKYRVLKSSREHSLLEIELGTGRKHQIRVHFSGLGHPVAGDKRYGAGTDPLKRLALHAHKLSFPHPVTKRLMAFESQTPQVFDLIISRMKSS